MSTPTKKAAPTKKAPAAKVAPAKQEETAEDRREQREANNLILREKIVALRDTDPKTTWAEINQQLNIATGRAMMLYMQATIDPKTAIRAKNEDDLKAKIAAGRENNLSWGQLAARSGQSEGFCKAAYAELTGKDPKGDRIGKGGRYPDGVTPPEKPVKEPKATPAKKAAPTKKGATPLASPVVEHLASLGADALDKALVGNKVTYKIGRGKTATFVLAELTGIVGMGEDTELTATKADGNQIVFPLANIIRVV